MEQLPDDVQAYRRTPDFTAETVPDALLRDHATKTSVWGLIHVIEGRLAYEISETGERVELTPDLPPGVIAPEIRHRVTPIGAVRFFVEFWR